MSNPISTTAPVQASVVVTQGGVPVVPDSVAWSVDNSSIATVDSSGVVTPVSAGAAVITAVCAVGSRSVSGDGVVNVTAVGDALVATIDFQPIAA